MLQVPCRFFAEGRCNNGVHCRFRHIQGAQVQEVWAEQKRRHMDELPWEARADAEIMENQVIYVPQQGRPGSAKSNIVQETLHRENDGIRCSGECEGPSALMRVYRRGHVLGSSGELYVELQGRCRVRLAIADSTKVSKKNRNRWEQVPASIAGKKFRSVEALHDHVRWILENTRGPWLNPDDEQLLWELFRFHPNPNKMQDVTFIKLGNNPYNQSTKKFWIMRNEHDGDDISYIKCLHGLCNVYERMEVIASIESRGDSFQIWVGNMAQPTNLPALPLLSHFAIRVHLESCALFVEFSQGISRFGPSFLLPRRVDSKSTLVTTLVDGVITGDVQVQWSPPFVLRGNRGNQFGSDSLPELRSVLEKLLAEQGSAADLSSVPDEQLRHSVSKGILDGIEGALQGSNRSRCAVDAQTKVLAHVASCQAHHLNRVEIQEIRAELQALKSELESRRAAEEQLRGELQDAHSEVSRARLSYTASNNVQASTKNIAATTTLPEMPHHHASDGNLDAISDGCPVSSAEPAASLVHSIRQNLMQQLPEPHLTMLRNSLRLMSAEMYSGPLRALWELVQNADDSTYTDNEPGNLRLVQTSTYIWLEYNEVGFSPEDLHALCNVGASNKGQNQTGEKGVGFKAAFILSQRPHVLSPPFQFFFDEVATDCPFPQVTPHWIYDTSTVPLPLPSRGTAIFLPLRDSCPQLAAAVKPTALLFLRRLKILTLDGIGPRCNYVRRGGTDGLVEIVAGWAGTTDPPSDGIEEEQKPVSHRYFICRHQCLLNQEDSSMSSKNGDVAVAFPLDDKPDDVATVFATLPLTPVPGLHTPLNAPFELTTSREALQVGSRRNIALRETLADLWLQAVNDARKFLMQTESELSVHDRSASEATPEHPPWAVGRKRKLNSSIHLQNLELRKLLLTRVWQLQPGPELLTSSFWAPFANRVRTGLRELPLIPVLDQRDGATQGSNKSRDRRRLPLAKCRNSGGLLHVLEIGLRDLEKLGLGIPVPHFLSDEIKQEISEFSVNDLLELLIVEGDVTIEEKSESEGPWLRGNEWRQRAVGALERHAAEIDMVRLRTAPLFPLDDHPLVWHPCGAQGIFMSVPADTPIGVMRVLDLQKSCAADRALLNRLGAGKHATVTDVSYAILRQSILAGDGTSTVHGSVRQVSSQPMSWAAIGFLGTHWEEIPVNAEVDSSLRNFDLRGMLTAAALLPSRGSARFYCAASELLCPYMFGAQPELRPQEGCFRIAEPPSADTLCQRLKWELIFLRLGAKLCPQSASTRLPKDLFSDSQAAPLLRPLLDHYEKGPDPCADASQLPLVMAQSRGLVGVRARCHAVDKAGVEHRLNLITRASTLRPNGVGSLLLGPAFEALIGPESVVDVGTHEEQKAAAVRLLGVQLSPSATLVLSALRQSAKYRCLKAAYQFLADEWAHGRLLSNDDELQLLRSDGVLLPENYEGYLACVHLVPVRDLYWWPILDKAFGRNQAIKIFFIEAVGIHEHQPHGRESEAESGADQQHSPASTPRAAQHQVMESASGDATGIKIFLPKLPQKRKSQEALGMNPDGDTETELNPSENSEHAAEALNEMQPRKVSVAATLGTPGEGKDGNEIRGPASPSSSPSKSKLPPLPTLRGTGLHNNNGDAANVDASRRIRMPPPEALCSGIFAERQGSDLLWGSQAPARQRIPLDEIWFTHKTVSEHFLHGTLAGQSVKDVAAKIAQGQMSGEELSLAVMKYQDVYWTLNNRSLYALRLARASSKQNIVAMASVFLPCPATAKFLQLRSGEDLEVPEPEAEAHSQEAEHEPCSLDRPLNS